MTEFLTTEVKDTQIGVDGIVQWIAETLTVSYKNSLNEIIYNEAVRVTAVNPETSITVSGLHLCDFIPRFGYDVSDIAAIEELIETKIQEAK